MSERTLADYVTVMRGRLSDVYARVARRFGGTGVGTEDPNIVGDAGPTDIPPGRDPDPGVPTRPD